jgi:hypothetical protein
MGNPGNMGYKTVHKRTVRLYRHSRDNNRRDNQIQFEKQRKGGKEIWGLNDVEVGR